VHSTKCKHHSPEWTILSHVNCFIQGEVQTQRRETRSSAIAVIADRTACSILTLFIVTATSRLLNKKSVCCQSANPINNYCGSASTNLQSAHLSACVHCSRHSLTGLGGRSHRTAQCHLSLLTSRLAALETPLLCIGSQLAVRFCGAFCG